MHQIFDETPYTKETQNDETIEVDIMSNAEEYYEQHYKNIFNQGLLSKLSGFMHRYIERPYIKSQFEKIIEVGAGHGQHFEYVKCKFTKYIETDLRLLNSIELHHDTRREKEIADAQDLKQFADSSFDRLVATCLIAHLPDPDRAVSEWRRVVKSGGVVDIYVPTEPGWALRVFRTFTTIPKSRKFGLNHKSIHYREHRNSWILCNLVITEKFSEDTIKMDRFPFRFFSWNFRLFDVYRISVIK